MKIIPYAKQDIDKSDINSVIKTLKSDFLTQGPKIEEFENKIKSYVSCKYAVAVNSATSGLHLSCLALGLNKNDYLWTSPNSFVASSNCALYCGAKVDFVDINPETFNICPKHLESKLIKTKKNKLPKVLVVVHFAGNPCDMKKISILSKKFNFKIVEDASHAIGSIYQKNKIGDCRYSDLTVFSFHPVKIITTGEGGMILTNKKNLLEKLKQLRNHGITKNIKKFHQNSKSSWSYKQTLLGYNYRMNDIEASLGISQLKKINKWIKKRNQIAQFYKKKLASYKVKFQHITKNSLSSYHLFIIIVDKKIRNKIYFRLKKQGITTNVHYIPIHTHQYYQDIGFNRNKFKNVNEYFNRCISLPMYPKLTITDLDKIIKSLAKILKK